MFIIDKSNENVMKFLGEQAIRDNTDYRFVKFSYSLKSDDDTVLFNLITGEISVLSNAEFETATTDFASEISKQMIKSWYLVPSDFDDDTFFNEYDILLTTINGIYTKPFLKNFTILTTTDCNARCFYCYEHGCEKKWMDEKIASDTADYIVNNGAPFVNLRWFGGEPLYNSKAIDIICNKLKENGVDFNSAMTSNAYLFDEAMVKNAVENWKLKSIQITLDGTEEIYNKVKAYIYKDDISPFKRVLNNIELLLKGGVQVKIRLNMDDHNYDDLYQLIDILGEKFANYNNITIYAHLLYEDSCKAVRQRNDDQRKILSDKCAALNDYIKSKGKGKGFINGELKIFKHCMADTDTSIMILPDGKLGKCEHYLDDKFIGSIYSDKLDFATLNWFKEITLPDLLCEKCELKPLCRSVKQCPSREKSCDAYKKEQKVKFLKNVMEFKYNNWKKAENGEAKI